MIYERENDEGEGYYECPCGFTSWTEGDMIEHQKECKDKDAE